jgi:hypothetical protein
LNNVLSRLLSSTNIRHVEVAPKQVAGVITNRLALRITVAKKLPLAEIPVEVAPKQVAGVITNRLALRITVAKKLPLAEIPPDQLIPSTIFGMHTDVVEGA